MRDRAGAVTCRMLVRPVDLTLEELTKLLTLGYKENIIDEKFLDELQASIKKIKS